MFVRSRPCENASAARISRERGATVNAGELFRSCRLKEAITAALEEVRNNPTDAGRRLFLSELLCFSGELQRADNQLDAVGTR